MAHLLKQSEKVLAKPKAAAPAAAVQEIEYFRKNQPRLHYDEYLSRNYSKLESGYRLAVLGE